MQRQRIAITGLVQGVGFRPFIFRLATSLLLTGYIRNTPTGIVIEIQGDASNVSHFLKKMTEEKPPLAYYAKVTVTGLSPQSEEVFSIQASSSGGQQEAWVLPDVATCPECLLEMKNPEDNRYQYPFINCTNCGPRFSIITHTPYDRHKTTMHQFAFCRQCLGEYQQTDSRRFHAEPIACPICGPQLSRTIEDIARLLLQGNIIALKGLGGYQLLVDATNERAVNTLRQRKCRPDKPLAVMFADVHALKKEVKLTKAAEKIISAKEAPIVVVGKRSANKLASSVAPDSRNLGCFLPYTPLHHLILEKVKRPIVCTSGNCSGEPIITDDGEAIKKLGTIADYVIGHNRPIAHHVDDSVVRLNHNQPLMIRRARGYAPLPIIANMSLPPLLALGGQQKNTVSFSQGNRVIVSQHLGDMDNQASILCLQKTIDEYQHLFKIHPEYIVCDAHPEYETTQLADSFGLPIIKVYHHEAHAAACLLDNQWEDDALVVAWDGTGLGRDNSLWGGEFLLYTNKQYQRVAHIKPFTLIGGEQAIKEPKRIGLALLYEIYGADCFNLPWVQTIFSQEEIRVYARLLGTNTNCVKTTSVGRLFDGVASLINLKHRVSYEGQAAMMLEDIADEKNGREYSASLDWTDMVEQIYLDSQRQINSHLIASAFHRSLASMIAGVALRIKCPAVALTGGCFQNVRLTQETQEKVKLSTMRVLVHRQLPPNDGSLSAGQIMLAKGQLCA
jgi:hydrogenase maturation protein HypF